MSTKITNFLKKTSIVNTLILYVVIFYWKKLNRHFLTCVLKVPLLLVILDVKELNKVMKTMFLINTVFSFANMFKFLIVMFIMKLYLGNDIFKYI